MLDSPLAVTGIACTLAISIALVHLAWRLSQKVQTEHSCALKLDRRSTSQDIPLPFSSEELAELRLVEEAVLADQRVE